MLSKNDLGQFDKLLERRLKPLKDDIVQVRSDVGQVSKDVDQAKDDIVHVRRDQKTIVNFFDREYLDLRKRIEKIEDQLGLSSSLS